MRRLKSTALMGMLLGAWLITAPQAAKGADLAARAPRDSVQFSPPTFVDPPKVLLGDAGDGRCPDPSQKCLKDVDDLLFGRTHLLRSDDLVLGFQGGAGLLLTSNSEILETSRQNLVQLGDGSANYSQPAVVGARLFNTASDVAVMLVLDRNSSLLQWRLDSSTATVASGTVALPGQPSDTTNYLSVVAGDFTGDGFDEIVVFLKGVVSSAIVGTAVDAQEPSQGLKFGPALDLNGADHLLPLKITKAAVVGQPRVFVAGPTAFVAACPTGDAGLGFESFAIDPQSLALVSAGTFSATIPEGNTACLHTVDMTAGRFTTALHDQLLVTYGMEGGNVKVLPFDLTDQGIAMQQQIYDTGYITGGGGAFIRSGRFDWSSPVDQAALLISNNFNAPGINTLRILSFDPNFTTQAGPELQAGATAGECVNDMAVGNFDHRDPNPGTPPPATIANPNLQVAIPFNNCDIPSVPAVNIRIFDVDPANQFQIALHSQFVIGPGNAVFLSTLAPVDLQGRSLRVGPLEGIVTLNQRSQVTLVLAAPPMHVDAVIPVESTTDQQIPYNITGAPAGFQAGYTFSSSTDTQTEVTTGVTSSWSAKEFVEGKATLGDCEVGDCASIDAKVSAEQTANSSQQSLAGQYAGSSQSLNVTTGFSDLVSYQSETLTIFVYPVIGRTVVCPSGQCPLTINVAGPDTLVYNEAQGGTDLPWYQPSWIPGNILSYPGSLAQLQAAAFPNPSDFQQLSQAVTWRTTSGGTANASATWTTGGSSGSTASVQQNLSFDASVSVSGQVGLEGVITVEGSAGVDVGGSEGLSTLTDSSKTLAATQGITFTRTAEFDDANYGYDVTPYIFGQQQPPSVVTANPPSANTVATYGALRTGHVVGIPTSGCCGFWQAWYGKAPDVALNQPKHWKISQRGNDPMDGSCRIFNPSSSDLDCLILGDRLPQNFLDEPIWLSEFHWMRGLFITGPSGGPQLTTATTGDQLLLQARVYNLSLAALPANAQVHVRFMGMPWDTSQNIPAAPSFQIGEQTIDGAQLAQLPPFNDGTQPNWTLVPQAFDTSGTHCGGQSCDNQDLMFWVVVWIQEDTPQGPRLISELPEHGLTSIPAAGEDFFLPAVGMGVATGVATREEAYSNNLGFYNQVFHIFPQTQAPQAPTPLEGEIGAQLTQVGAAHQTLQRGQSTALAAKVQTGGRDLRGGLEVAFYDGDPGVDGTLIGLQYLPHLYANRTHDFRVLFTPQHCGRRTVYVVAGNGTRHEHTAKLPPIVVAGEECTAGEQR